MLDIYDDVLNSVGVRSDDQQQQQQQHSNTTSPAMYKTTTTNNNQRNDIEYRSNSSTVYKDEDEADATSSITINNLPWVC